MKIINRTEFLKLPSGTLYSEFTPMLLSGLFVKYSSSENNYIESSLIDDIQDRDSLDNVVDFVGKRITLNLEYTTGNGMYEEGQLYAVYEKEDINRLIAKLNSCVEVAM